MSSGAGRTIGMIGLGIAGGLVGAFIAGPAMLGLTVGGSAYGIVVGMGYMAGSFIGQMVFPAPSVKNVPFEGYPLQSSGKGQSVPVEYGTTRMGGNVIYMSDKTHYHFEEAGHKGGGGGGAEQTGYRRSFCIAICEGERTVLRMWEGKHEVTIGRVYSSGGVAMERPSDDSRPFGGMVGGKGEAQWSQYEQDVTVFDGDGANEGLADLIGEDYARYKNLCCVFFDSYDLGSVDMLPNFTFEVTDPANVTPLGFLVGGNSTAFRLDVDYKIAEVLVQNKVYVKTVDLNQATGRWLHGGGPNAGQTGDILHIFGSDNIDLGIAFEAPAGGWGVNVLNTGSRFSKDGQYVFVYTINPERVYKYDLSDGSIVWEVNLDSPPYTLSSPAHTITIDSNDNVYIYTIRTALSGGGPWQIAVFNSAGVLIDQYAHDYYGTRSSAIHKTGGDANPLTGATGYLAMAGTTLKNFPSGPDPGGCIINLSTKEITDIDFGGKFIFYAWDCCWAGSHFYFYTQSVDGKQLWKVSTGGKIILSVAKPATAPSGSPHGICPGPNNTIMVHGHGGDPGSGTYVWIYDADLNLINEIDCNDPHVTNWSFSTSFTAESVWMFTGVDPPAGLDANPADIIEDQLTNTRYGAGMSSDYINAASFATIWQYCQDNDLLISPEFSMSRPVLDNVQYVCSHFGGFVYWIGGVLYLGAWRAETPSIHIHQEDLVSDDGPPVQVHKRKYSESRNSIEVSWRNRADIYGPAITPAKDDVDIRHSGKLRKQQIDLGACKRPELAQKLALRYLIDSMYRFSTYSFTLGYKHSLLKVGTVVLLSDGYKIEDQRIRIIGIAEAKDGRMLEVEAIDDISDHYPDLTWTPQTTARTPDVDITTDDLGDPIIASREDWHIPAVRLSLTPTTAYVDGWHIYISRDGITYSFMETVHISGVTGGAANSSGSLLSTIPSARAITYRGDESFLVDIGTVTDLRTDITDQQFFDGTRLIKVGNEIMAYKTCEEQPTEGQWRVTSLIRGMYQTEPVAHAIGETVSTLDINYVGAFAASDIGKTLYVKALTAYGNVGRAIADADAHEIVIKGNYQRPYGASAVRLTSDEMDGGTPDYDGATFDAYWNLAGKTAGFNIGGQDGGGTWVYGDDDGDLVPQSGVAFGSYLQDPALQGVDLIFREQDGTYIGTTGLGIVSTAAVTKATDLGGNNPARIDVVPRHSLQATRIETVLVDDGS